MISYSRPGKRMQVGDRFHVWMREAAKGEDAGRWEKWNHSCNLTPRLTSPPSVPGRRLKTEEQPQRARRQTFTTPSGSTLPRLQREGVSGS